MLTSDLTVRLLVNATHTSGKAPRLDRGDIWDSCLAVTRSISHDRSDCASFSEKVEVERGHDGGAQAG